MRCELCAEQTAYVGRLFSISLAGYVVHANRDRFSHNQVYRVGIRVDAITPDGILLLKAAPESKDAVSFPIELGY